MGGTEPCCLCGIFPQWNHGLDSHTDVQTCGGIIPGSEIYSFLHEPTKWTKNPSHCQPVNAPSGLSCWSIAGDPARPSNVSFPIHLKLTAAFSCVCMKFIIGSSQWKCRDFKTADGYQQKALHKHFKRYFLFAGYGNNCY